jgi:hypothetical protein
VQVALGSYSQLYILFTIFGIQKYISLKNWHILQKTFTPDFFLFSPFSPLNVADWQACLKIYISAGFTIFSLSESK